MVRACLLFTAGTNCDRETDVALRLAGAEPETLHINRLREKPELLRDYQLLVIPGGFSYGDYIASGRIFASEFTHHLASEVRRFHDDGKLILGICNGFQVLVRSGLLPATAGLFQQQTTTLESNESGRFEDRWVHLRTEPSPCVFTRDFAETCELPVAHAEGRFAVLDRATLGEIESAGQVVFRYVAADGRDADYPDNPNGSVAGIAGICDPSGRILGMMPHPERFVRPEQHPRWHRSRPARPAGMRVFANAVSYAEENL